MPIRHASAVWNGPLKEGNGTVKAGSGAFHLPFSFATRFEERPGTNPEELIGAALAGCYSMFLGAVLAGAGFPAKSIASTAKVHLGEGPKITLIEIDAKADVPNVDDKTFQESVAKTNAGCPIKNALAGPEIRVSANLVK